MCATGSSLALALLLAVAPPIAEAQEPASTVEQLRILVKPGDTISVTLRSGGEIRGRLVNLSSSSITLRAGGPLRDFQERDIVRIRERRPDSVANGARWGGLGGAAYGLVTGSILTGDGNGAQVILPWTLLHAGLGAGIGMAIDAIVVRRRVIYENRPKTSASLTVAPLLSRRGKGVLVSLGF